jgi:ABC-type uncharacterized transport system ATPase subunit
MLVARNIIRRFGPLIALDRVDFEARPGEIVALLGENGAGKSTLINILAGRLRLDAGRIELDGRALPPGSPAAALGAGVAAVHQSPMLFERMSWEENLALCGFDTARTRSSGLTTAIDVAAVAARAGAIASRLGFVLPPRAAKIEHRSMSERVRLEILRALSFDPRVLILDEPTGLLAPNEISAFLDLLRSLRADARIVILVTHKLAEALAIADRIVILRRGRVVANRANSGVTQDELAALMIGELPISVPRARSARSGLGATVLELKDLVVDRDGWRALDAVSLDIAAGEIVGIAGVDGNGQGELVEAIAGVRRPLSGSIRATSGATNGPLNAIAVIAENRDLDGLVLEMPLWENMMLSETLLARACGRFRWLNAARAKARCAEMLVKHQIRAAAGARSLASELSGGNRQRLCVARALESRPRVIAAHNVTRGLDVAATAEVHRMLNEFASRGGAVLLISSDLDELQALCGRIAVLSRGRLRVVPPEERNPARLGLLMAGTG